MSDETKLPADDKTKTLNIDDKQIKDLIAHYKQTPLTPELLHFFKSIQGFNLPKPPKISLHEVKSLYAIQKTILKDLDKNFKYIIDTGEARQAKKEHYINAIQKHQPELYKRARDEEKLQLGTNNTDENKNELEGGLAGDLGSIKRQALELYKRVIKLSLDDQKKVLDPYFVLKTDVDQAYRLSSIRQMIPIVDGPEQKQADSEQKQEYSEQKQEDLEQVISIDDIPLILPELQDQTVDIEFNKIPFIRKNIKACLGITETKERIV